MTWPFEGVMACLVRLRLAAKLGVSMESSGSRQRTLPFGRKEYASAWSSVPQRDRKEAMTLWARVIAAAARVGRQPKGGKR
jgi:hypothetical protein